MADETRFLRDVRGHKMTIEMDQGVHRCIHFGRPGSSAYHFRLVTWPGGLSISGDCGNYTFSRLRDMFDFFRDTDMENRINPSYWHEKMQAQDKSSPARGFSLDKFKVAVREDMNEWQVRLGDADKIRREVDRQLEVEPPSCSAEAYAWINDFEASDGNNFEHFESNVEDYSYSFIWCLRAIVWGIKQYDLVKQGRTQADHDRRVLAGER